jgi:hypothetical protein
MLPDTQLKGHDTVGGPEPYRPHLLGHTVATLILAGVAAVSAWLFLGGAAPAGTTHIGDTTYRHAHVTSIDTIKWPDQRSSPL